MEKEKLPEKKLDKEKDTKTEKTQEEQKLPEKKTKPKTNIWQKIIYFLGFSAIFLLMILMNNIRTPENQTLIMYIAISVMINAIVLLAVFGTGIGIEITNNFLNKFKYKKGIYVQTLLFMKSGMIKKFFKKKDSETDTIKINNKKYTTNPKLRFIHQGIPTYVHKEGTPDPINIWQDDLAGDLSCAELDNVMNSKGIFDVKAWLEQNKTILIMCCFIMVGAAITSTFFGYMGYEMLRDGTFKMGSVVCKNIPAAQVIPTNPLG